ncbi:MAG: hypothetical protein JXN64_12490 [Spirochaetes bacterium]|nr:hypothetical protein [Spirochaetota bacterium]
MHNNKIVSLNEIEKTSRAAIIPAYSNKKKTGKLKELSKSKGNCLFTRGISHSLMNFIYRAVVQLKLKDKKLIFSKGAVKINNISVINATASRELDWDVGISIRIPYNLKYNDTIKLNINNSEYKFKIMELIVLSALLHIAYPSKKSIWCSRMSALIIAQGWKQLEKL